MPYGRSAGPFASFWLAVAAIGCAGERPSQPEGWDSAVALRPARDLDARPGVLEVDLTARVEDVEIVAGKRTPTWTYNGGLPGPLLRARVGDRVIVHLRNELPAPTTVHWHGVRLPAEMDGAPGHSQPETPSGGGFTYDFVVPDAGLYWYHPHVDSAVQAGNGLYGPLLVEDPDEPAALGDELVLVLSDITVREDGSLEDPEAGGNLGTLFGREGDILLVNGRVNPVIGARAGLRQRWRIVNAAKSRYYQLLITDHRFTRIGGDGGLLEHPVEEDRILLTPGERADVLVTPRGAPGATLSVRWVPYDRGYGATFGRPEVEAFRLRLADEPLAEGDPLPAIARGIEALDTAAARRVDLQLTREEGPGDLVMGINGVPSWEAEPLVAAVGETAVWTVENTMEFDHPFHLHGFFFQVLGADGQPVRPLAWKDTVNVPVDGAARFAVRYDNRPGMWMFHCHILDHADAGMMGMLQVVR
ncbi:MULTISPECIES: multicopper oxidase family protein [Sorangium]|uniref:Oxidoreductase n=1 Tax=Sorangium cellulosum (strain So ce56) TaxID=448385 RepID=A9F169_SORC5|nr:multicopper oxidase family protein [Sorangium cellulosum]CAN91337.1 oxidoreductase [Sorangium cellulosum So ce56]